MAAFAGLATSASAQWGSAPWTNDEDSGVAAAGGYTMAVNANGGSVTVNGIVFDAWPSGGSGTNFSTDGGGGAYGGDNNNSITGSSADLSTTFIYGISPRTITLSGLTAGATYETSFYSTGWDDSGRTQTFASGTDSAVIDQDAYGNNKGIRIHYTFVADATTRVLTITQAGGSVGTFHLCAMTNRMTVEASPQAQIQSFGLPGMPGIIDGFSITMYVPGGMDVTNLGPEFTLSTDATAYKTDPRLAPPAAVVINSGDSFNFTSPVHYWVQSSDGLITNDYTVTVAEYPPTTSYTWVPTSAGTYNWNFDDLQNNWNNYFPNAIDDTANFNINLAGAQTINLNEAITVGAINLGDSGASYFGVAIAAGTAGSLVMDVTAGNATIARTNTNVADTISANIQLNDNLIVSDANASDSDGGNFGLKLTGTISESGGSKSVTKDGNGAVTLSGTNSYSGGTIVNGSGFFRFGPDSIGTGALTITGSSSNPPDITSNNLALNGNEVIINGDFKSHYGFKTGTGPVKLAAAGIKVLSSVDIQGVVTAMDGSNSLNALDINLGGIGGWGAAQTISSNITMRGNQTMTHDSGWGIGAWPGYISGVISDEGNGYSLTKAGNSRTVLTGANTYTGDTIVSAGALELGSTGSLSFKITDSGSNKITGPAPLVLNGAFNIDISAVTVTAGTWPLVELATFPSLPWGPTFSLSGFTKSGDLWTRVEGGKTWIFDQTTGVLAIPAAWILSFNYGSYAGVIDQTAQTIALTVPYGTDLATLAPTFTLASGTCNQTSGAPPSPTFASSSTATYTVTDGAIVRSYAVTVTVNPVPGPGGVDLGLALWLDASAADTMTLTDSTVTEWRDKMGSTAKATLAAGTPALAATGIGGIPTVHFDTLSRMNDGVNHSAPVTIFYVSRQTGSANNRVLGAVSNNWLMGYHGGQRNRFFFEGWVNEAGTAADTSPHLYAATIGGSGKNSTVYAEGAQVASNQSGIQGPNNLQLNGYNSGNELSDCDISEVLIYNRVLSNDELNVVGYYLSTKYSLTTSYPGPEKAMSNVYFAGLGYAHPSDAAGTSLVLNVATGTPVSALSPTFDVSLFASCDYASGTERNFSTPQTYRVTASDATYQDYTVAVVPYSGYAARVMASNPFAYWPLNEGKGLVAYDNSSGNNGSYNATGVTYGVAGPEGENAVSLSGAGGVALRVAHAEALCPDTAFSVELWVKPAAVPPNSSPQYVASNARISGNREGWYLAQDAGGTFGTGTNSFVVRMFNRNGTTMACQVWTEVDTARWYHLVLTWDGTTARLYKDGVSSDVQNKGWATPVSYFGSTHSDPMTLGIRSDNNFPWAGTADHLAFYNRALTAQEIEFHATGTSTTLSYADWAATKYPSADLTDPAADLDGDGRSNFEEYAFGLDPTSGTSLNPIIAPLDKGTAKFSYTRTANTGLSYTVWTSTDLQAWNGPAVVTENVGTPVDGVETVQVTLSSPPAGDQLFLRVQAE